MRYLILLTLTATVLANCKVKTTSGSGVKADTTNLTTRTGVSDQQDFQIQWSGATTGTLTNTKENIYMFVQPVICLMRTDKVDQASCDDIWRTESGSVQVFGEYPVKVGGKSVNPKIEETIQGKRLNEAAERLYKRLGYGESGDYQLGFKVFVRSFGIFAPDDKMVNFGMIPLQNIDPQTQIRFNNKEYSGSGATATMLFYKVAGKTSGGAVGTRMKWGNFTPKMREFLNMDESTTVTSVQQEFFNQELEFFNAGYTTLRLKTEKLTQDSVPLLDVIYANDAGNKCLHVTQADEGLFSSDPKLKSEVIPCP